MSSTHAGKKDGILKAWEEGKIMIPDDGHPGQLSSRAVDHKAWMRAETNTYEIDYEEVIGTVQDCARYTFRVVCRCCEAFAFQCWHIIRRPVHCAACMVLRQTFHSTKKSPDETLSSGCDVVQLTAPVCHNRDGTWPDERIRGS